MKPGEPLVIVLDAEKAAALALAAASAVAANLVPPAMIADVGEALGAYNEALGNDNGPTYAATMAEMRRRFPS